jgi:hypothetical protein
MSVMNVSRHLEGRNNIDNVTRIFYYSDTLRYGNLYEELQAGGLHEYYYPIGPVSVHSLL